MALIVFLRISSKKNIAMVFLLTLWELPHPTAQVQMGIGAFDSTRSVPNGRMASLLSLCGRTAFRMQLPIRCCADVSGGIDDASVGRDAHVIVGAALAMLQYHFAQQHDDNYGDQSRKRPRGVRSNAARPHQMFAPSRSTCGVCDDPYVALGCARARRQQWRMHCVRLASDGSDWPVVATALNAVGFASRKPAL